MVSKAFKKCLVLIEKMIEHRFVNQISRKDLEKLISMYIGADYRTIKLYLRVCVQFEFLKPHIFKGKGEVTVFKINLVKADAAIKEFLGRDMKQLSLFPE